MVLPHLERGAARLLRFLGLHPGPDVAVGAAASLAGVPGVEVRSLLAELTRAHLLSEHAPGRFALHDLLRAYAAELTNTQDPPAGRRAATHRMLDHYLHTASTARGLLNPHREPLPLGPPQPGT